MVPFVYLASVCRSLQCLISALTQVGGGGLLSRFTCSVVLCGGRGIADKCHWRVWGALTVFRSHWVCPRSWHVRFPCLHCSGSRWPYQERALSSVHLPCLSHSGSGFGYCTKAQTLLDLPFVLPHLGNSGNQELDKSTLPRCSALYPLHGPSLSFWAGRSDEPCISSGKLISGCNLPGRCQPSRIPGSLWLETGSLFVFGRGCHL